MRPACQKLLQFHDATRQEGGTKAPWICKGSGSGVVSEQLHLLPFRWVTATLPAAGTAPLDGNAARGCRPPLRSPDNAPSQGLSLSLLGTVPVPAAACPRASVSPQQGTGRTPVLARGKQRWDRRTHIRVPPRITRAGADLVSLFGDTGPSRDTRSRTRGKARGGSPARHPALNFEPGLCAFLGRAAALSLAAPKLRLCPLSGENPRSQVLAARSLPCMDPGLPLVELWPPAPAAPAQPASRVPRGSRRAALKCWWLGRFPLENRQETTGS